MISTGKYGSISPEESKESDMSKLNYILEFTPNSPLNLSNLTREDNLKLTCKFIERIKIKHLNLDLSQEFSIQQGLSLSQSILNALPPLFWQDIKIFKDLSFEPLALIYPDYVMEEKIKQIKACNVNSINGLYQKLQTPYAIPEGQSKYGLPAGENTVDINKQGSLLEITINNKPHISYVLDSKWKNIVFVKSKPKKLEAGDENITFLELIPSDDTSRRHATIQMIDGKLFMVDGTEIPSKKSTNGVYVYLSQTQPVIMNNNENYIFGDFRITLTLQQRK